MANQNMYNEMYDVFLSYRRDGGETMAILLRDRLTAKGYRVFLDVESLNSGSFNEKLLHVISECTDFIVVLSKGSLERCANEGDWVRVEIAHALAKKKNIVPIMLRSFEWPASLPDDIDELRIQNGVNASSNEYFDAAVDRLTDKFLLSQPRKTHSAAALPKRIAIMAGAVAVMGGLSLGGFTLWRNMQNESNDLIAADGLSLNEINDSAEDDTDGTPSITDDTPTGTPTGTPTSTPTNTPNTQKNGTTASPPPANAADKTTAPTNSPTATPASTPKPTITPTDSPAPTIAPTAPPSPTPAATNVTDQSYTVVNTVYTMNIKYTGSWNNGKPDGYGVATVTQDVPGRFNTGDKLEGNWLNGLIEGPGTYTSGTYQLKGNFIKGLKEGTVEQYSNGELIGTLEFKNGSPVQ